MKIKYDIQPICKICEAKFNSLNGLCTHISKKHNLTNKEYFDTYFKTKNDGICLLCSKPTKWTNKLNQGYRDYCSNYCATHHTVRNEQIVETRKNNNKTWFPNGVISREDGREDYIKRNGHDYLYNDKDYKERCKIAANERILNKYSEIIKSKNCTLVDYSALIYTCRCNICNNVFKITNQGLKLRLNNNSPLCTYCNPASGITSDSEKSLYNFIKTICPTAEHNNRSILNGKELDVYIKELNLAFEFDGKYWHADPRLYNETSIIGKRTAKEIWEQDALKNKLCESLGITLIRINELDWLKNNDIIKQSIIELIQMKQLEL